MASEILYRDHAWSLESSMKTLRTINTVEDIRIHLNDALRWFGEEVDSIEFKDVGFDKRIGWNTYNVVATYKWKEEPFVAWQTNGIPEK